MKKHQRNTGAGAFILAAFFVAFLLFVTTILPAQGLAVDKGALYNPGAALEFAAGSAMLRGFYLIYFLAMIGLALLVPGMHKLLSNHAPQIMGMASTFGGASAALFFINSIIAYLNLPLLIKLSSDFPDEANGNYLAKNVAKFQEPPLSALNIP